MILLASMFRNAAPHVDRYFSQVESLRENLDVQLVLAEGDSSDDTYALVEKHLDPHDTLLKVDHGGRHYGSVDHPQRWTDIAKVATAIIAEAAPRLKSAEAFIWVESDLLWNAEGMTALLRDVQSVPAIAPMILDAHQPRFYDVWGYRKNGVRFTPQPPYAALDGITTIDSCGSCFVLAPTAFPSLLAWDGRWPFRAGGQLHINPQIVVRHP